MSEVARAASDPSGDALLQDFARTASESSGVDTFSRYVWQAKQALRIWIASLADESASRVVCERVEDVVVISGGRLRCIQMKTRERGSWSAAAMAASGLDSLARSYVALRESGLHELATFELWLEGPTTDNKETRAFVDDPRTAPTSIRKALRGYGIKQSWVSDFLGRLVIRPSQPTRSYIDDRAIRELHAIWPALSFPEVCDLYDRLLQVVVRAQTGDEARRAAVDVVIQVGADSDLGEIDAQSLTRSALIELTPPRPGESVEFLLARLERGEAASMLELKLRAAGASDETIRQIQGLRASAEVQRQLVLARGAGMEKALEDLADRTLLLANAVARRVHLNASSVPAAAARPAEAIYHDLMSRPGDVGSVDTADLFKREGFAIVGYLAHLSDSCRYPWRAA